MSNRSSLGRTAVEGVLIVTSILLAFGIDAAWDARRERAEFEALVELLEVDLDQNVRALRLAQANAERAAAGMTALIEVMHGSEMPSADSLAALIVSSIGGSRFQGTVAAYDAALGTTAWGLIPPATKVALARFARESRANEETIVTQSYIGLTHVITRYGGLSSVMNDQLREFSGLPTSDREPDLDGLLSDPEFESWVSLHMIAERNLAIRYSIWIAELLQVADELAAL